MKKELINKPVIYLAGVAIRTNNKNEIDPHLAKIGKLAWQFWKENSANQIANRKNPGVTFSVYTDYDSNEHGDYTYFIGEEVTTFDNVSDAFKTLIIPAAKYQKFTTQEGPMPQIIIDAWQAIWKMSAADFGGSRAYKADFEIYDERAKNPDSAMVDIYLGIND